jgi:predicted metal-binding protein
MKKIGIFRCMQTEDFCPSTKCFEVAREGTEAFKEIGPVEVIGFLSCGGDPGKKVARRAKMMVEKGAEAIVLGSCMTKDNIPEGTFACPNIEKIKEILNRTVGDKVQIIDWTHE